MPARWTSDLDWVRPGRQARSQSTQARLVDAAAALFGEKGLDGTTVAEIAEQAGTSVGSFYHHFRDKTSALRAVFSHLADDLEYKTSVALDPGNWEGASATDILRSYVQVSLADGRENPGQKTIFSEASRIDPLLRDRYNALRAELDRGLAALVLARRDEVGHPDPHRAVRFAVDQINLTLQARLDTSLVPTRFEDLTDDELLAVTMDAMRRYLEIGQDG